MSQVHNESRNQVLDYDTITVTPCTPHIGAEIGKIESDATAFQPPGAGSARRDHCA
jgi:hypothetical protein